MFLASVHGVIDPGTPIYWVPQWIADTWRGALFVAIAVLVLRMAYEAADDRQIASWVIWWRASLTVLLLDAAWLQAERWGDPITVEGVPVTSLAVALAVWSAFTYERWMRDKIGDS
jgi:hypothetical protein